MGSTRVARRAGIQLEPSAAAAMTAVMAAKTTGSFGLTPRNRFATRCASTNASTRPILRPAPVSQVRTAQNQPEHVSALRAQRQAHANFACTFADQIGHHAEDADDCKQQGKRGIDAKHPGCMHQSRELLMNRLLPGLDILQGQRRIKTCQGFVCRRGQARRVSVCRQEVSRSFKRHLSRVHVERPAVGSASTSSNLFLWQFPRSSAMDHDCWRLQTGYDGPADSGPRK